MPAFSPFVITFQLKFAFIFLFMMWGLDVFSQNFVNYFIQKILTRRFLWLKMKKKKPKNPPVKKIEKAKGEGNVPKSSEVVGAILLIFGTVLSDLFLRVYSAFDC